MTEPHWDWRNTRNIRVMIVFSLTSWGIRHETIGDVFGKDWSLMLGPLSVSISADIGNNSSENWLEARIGLSQAEAWDRAAKRQKII